MEFQNSNHLQLGPLFLFELHVPTNVILVLRYSILNSGKPLYLIFCNLHILSFALRYRENSHGILTFK